MEVYECEDAVQRALSRPRPRHIVKIINAHLAQQSQDAAQPTGEASAGPTKPRSIDFVCIECRDDGPEGRARAFFSAPPPTVVFCANRLHSVGEVEETMVHELIHAYDFTVRKMDITKPAVLACSEIRSARESECYNKAQILANLMPDVEFFQNSKAWLHKRCVREHAVRSTRRRFKGTRGRGCEFFFDAKDRTMASARDAQNGSLNMNDPRVRANLYMQTHGVKELFEGLATVLLFHRPADPRAFLAEHLAELQRAKQNQTHIPFFEEQDLGAMFAAFDVNDRGYITPQQYDQALRSLGIEQPTLRLPESIEEINQSLFARSMTQELKNASASLM